MKSPILSYRTINSTILGGPSILIFASLINAVLEFNVLKLFRDKVREIKNGYDRLERLSARGPNSKEFIEPKVQGLWMLAVNGNFSQDELASLRVSYQSINKVYKR